MKRFLLVLVLVSLVVVPAHFGRAAMDESIVLSMSFEDGSGVAVADQSMYGNNGTIAPENVAWVAGRDGGAIEITGQMADALVVPGSDSLKIEGQITMMAWINPTAWSGDNHTQLYDKRCNNGGETNFCYGMDVGGNGGRLAAFLGSGDGRPVPGVDAPVELEKWQHVAATYDGAVAKFYLDGILVGEVPEVFSFQGTNDFDVRIGCSDSRANYTYNGLIDDAVIFNRAISAGEVSDMMTGDTAAVSSRGKLATTWASIKD